MPADHAHLAWPFFDDAHRAYARELAAWCSGALPPLEAGVGVAQSPWKTGFCLAANA